MSRTRRQRSAWRVHAQGLDFAETRRIASVARIAELPSAAGLPDRRHRRRPPIAQRSSGSANSPLTARSAEAKETEQPREPGMCGRGIRQEQPLDPLEPEARVARALVELDPRHAAAPQVGFRHRTLLRTNAARLKPRRRDQYPRQWPNARELPHTPGEFVREADAAGTPNRVAGIHRQKSRCRSRTSVVPG